jgi:hypothetical protein
MLSTPYQRAGASEVMIDWPAPFDRLTLDRLARATGRH